MLAPPGPIFHPRRWHQDSRPAGAVSSKRTRTVRVRSRDRVQGPFETVPARLWPRSDQLHAPCGYPSAGSHRLPCSRCASGSPRPHPRLRAGRRGWRRSSAISRPARRTDWMWDDRIALPKRSARIERRPDVLRVERCRRRVERCPARRSRHRVRKRATACQVTGLDTRRRTPCPGQPKVRSATDRR